jgi:hypothetical protein
MALVEDRSEDVSMVVDAHDPTAGVRLNRGGCGLAPSPSWLHARSRTRPPTPATRSLYYPKINPKYNCIITQRNIDK